MIFIECYGKNVYIDDEAIALAASVVNANMSEAEKTAAANLTMIEIQYPIVKNKNPFEVKISEGKLPTIGIIITSKTVK